jgi:hypothetical protein
VIGIRPCTEADFIAQIPLCGEALFISILPHNRQMLTFALGRGYDTLNTMELRKELAGEPTQRSRISFLDLEFRMI